MTLERSQPKLVTWFSSGQTITNPQTDLSLTRSGVGHMGELPIISKLRQKKTNNKKRQKRDPTQGEDTPFTDGTFLKLQPRKEGTLHESMAKFVNRELRLLLQAINKKAVIWSIQEFNEWNRKEGARVRRMEKLNHHQGWWKEKRLYLEQRCLWNRHYTCQVLQATTITSHLHLPTLAMHYLGGPTQRGG